MAPAPNHSIDNLILVAQSTPGSANSVWHGTLPLANGETVGRAGGERGDNHPGRGSALATKRSVTRHLLRGGFQEDDFEEDDLGELDVVCGARAAACGGVGDVDDKNGIARGLESCLHPVKIKRPRDRQPLRRNATYVNNVGEGDIDFNYGFQDRIGGDDVEMSANTHAKRLKPSA